MKKDASDIALHILRDESGCDGHHPKGGCTRCRLLDRITEAIEDERTVEFDKDAKKHPCYICERREGGLTFAENFGEDVKLRICMECVGMGIRWLAKQGREDLEKQEASH